MLRAAGARRGKGDAIREKSKDVTIHGFVIAAATAQAIELRGGGEANQHLVIARNRIAGNGSANCQGSVLISVDNDRTVVVSKSHRGQRPGRDRNPGRRGPGDLGIHLDRDGVERRVRRRGAGDDPTHS